MDIALYKKEEKVKEATMLTGIIATSHLYMPAEIKEKAKKALLKILNEIYED